MKKVITPGIFLLAALLSTACTDTDDIDTDADQPDTAACCAPETPRGDELLFDSFDAGRRARERFDWLRRVR